MYFLALSHAPPALLSILARVNPVVIPPISNPTTPGTPKTTPMTTGTIIAISAGTTISFCAPLVAIATHFAYSGLPVPSIIPGISRNCRLTSSTILPAFLPTAFIAIATNTKHIIAPMKSPASNIGLKSDRLYAETKSLIPACDTSTAC